MSRRIPVHILVFARNLQSCLSVKNGFKHPSQWYNIPHFAHWCKHVCSVAIPFNGSESGGSSSCRSGLDRSRLIRFRTIDI